MPSTLLIFSPARFFSFSTPPNFSTGDNPTPFHYSFVTLQVQSAGKAHALTVAPMVAPLSSQRYPVDIPLGSDARLSVAAINDYGGFTEPLNLALPATP